MNRLIIENVEGRITLGIVMFVAIMILIGWVAINEPARMASFTEQQNGRAIERGAELFAANCSSCHGVNGLGSPQGPALNSPHFFGYDFLADVNAEIVRFQREEADLQNVVTELTRRREEALTEFNALAADQQSGEAGRLLLVEIGNIDARLLDDEAAVTARLAAIESGSLASEESNPVLTEDELANRQVTLQSNIPNRLRVINLALTGDGTAENAGLLAQRQSIIDSFATARGRGYLPRLDEELASNPSPLEFTNYLAEEANRLAQVSWAGTQEGYILTTLIHGRPGSNTVWPGPMVAWSQRGGGPLRDDQIRDIIAYIMNWDKGDNWTMADLNAVQQFARLHDEYSYSPPNVDTPPPTEAPEYDPELLGPMECTGLGAVPDCVGGTGTVAEIVANLPEGDAANGTNLYVTYGCSGCHLNGALGPNITGTWARVESERLTTPEHEGIFSVEEYVVASILYPGEYLADGLSDLMPHDFGVKMTTQELADIVAYIREQ